MFHPLQLTNEQDYQYEQIYNSGLRFDLTNNLAHLPSGVGDIMLNFDQESHLEHFMQEIGYRDVES